MTIHWSIILLAAGVSLSNCATDRQAPTATAMPAPAAPNETVLIADVAEARVVDSSTLNILPRQPIVVVRLRLISVQASEGSWDFKPGETITAYSKDASLTNLRTNRVSAIVSFRGDERGGSFWLHEVAALNAR